jgi:hypothetical protein
MPLDCFALPFSKARMLYSLPGSPLIVRRAKGRPPKGSFEVERGLERLTVARLSSRPRLMVD